jgi:hypothetical protein
MPANVRFCSSQSAKFGIDAPLLPVCADRSHTITS